MFWTQQRSRIFRTIRINREAKARKYVLTFWINKIKNTEARKMTDPIWKHRKTCKKWRCFIFSWQPPPPTNPLLTIDLSPTKLSKKTPLLKLVITGRLSSDYGLGINLRRSNCFKKGLIHYLSLAESVPILVTSI